MQGGRAECQRLTYCWGDHEMDCEFSFFSATSHFLRHSPFLTSPSPLQPPSFSISSSIPSTLLAAASAAPPRQSSGIKVNGADIVLTILQQWAFCWPCIRMGCPPRHAWARALLQGTEGKRGEGQRGWTGWESVTQQHLTLARHARLGRSILRHEQWRQSAENGTK